MSNTRLWDKLGKTDPANTKAFKRAGGFSGTAIKPMWSFKRMTEEFGPCGIGWGVNEPSFQVVNGCEGEVLVYCTVSVWYNEWRPAEGTRTEGVEPSSKVFGVGGDKVVVKQSSGLRSDDEAFKKAYTDAIGNALKLIGVGADVHMGLFDDSKYVNEMRHEFAEDIPPKPSTRPVETAKSEHKTFDEIFNAIFGAEDMKALQEAFEWAKGNPNIDKKAGDDLIAAKDDKKKALLQATNKLNPNPGYVAPNFEGMQQ